MLFYLHMDSKGQLNISPDKGEIRGGENSEVLLPGFPFGVAWALLERVGKTRKPAGQKQVLNHLAKITQNLQNYRWVRAEPGQVQESDLGVKSVWAELAKRLAGRQLSEADLQKLAEECHLPLREILDFCQLQVEGGRAEWLPALGPEGGSWRCLRCGERRVEAWPSLYGDAATCPSCASLGALSSLQALYRSRSDRATAESNGYEEEGALRPGEGLRFSPHWQLSSAQEQAGRQVQEFVCDEGQRQALLWAACGAGKTEVCFPAAAWALAQGQKILFAAPRQDVVHDVEPRLRRDFPGLPISLLTGRSTERFLPASFVLATTHQLLRFYSTFDLIFLDEMDAFPYQGNRALAWGLRQALKKEGKILYLTATPSAESLRQVERGEMGIIRLPARHHRHPVPVPEFREAGWESDKEPLAQKGRVISGVRDQINTLALQGPVMVFVPKISWVNPLVERLQREFPGWAVAGSYSADAQRGEKIKALKDQRYRIFVSTSILERGVTIPGAQVMVLAADHPLFDERALVQMAGRVGRTREKPDGQAVFLAAKKTPALAKAIAWIREQNQLAFNQGLIDYLPE